MPSRRTPKVPAPRRLYRAHRDDASARALTGAPASPRHISGRRRPRWMRVQLDDRLSSAARVNSGPRVTSRIVS